MAPLVHMRHMQRASVQWHRLRVRGCQWTGINGLHLQSAASTSLPRALAATRAAPLSFNLHSNCSLSSLQSSLAVICHHRALCFMLPSFHLDHFDLQPLSSDLAPPPPTALVASHAALCFPTRMTCHTATTSRTEPRYLHQQSHHPELN
jgi:hypothetical protein